VLIELCSLVITVEAYWSIVVEISRFERGVGQFEGKFQGKRASPPTNFGIRKLESLGYRMVKTKLPKISTG